MIVIVGAGLTGLSTAYHLGEVEYQVYEREGEAGGLCRSFAQDGYTFDQTGHLLHCRRKRTMRIIDTLLPRKFKLHLRRASVYSNGVFTPYPFQANLYGLPKAVKKECLRDFIKAWKHRHHLGGLNSGSCLARKVDFLSLKDWIVSTFGNGIARHFLLPYNEKLWKTDLRTISTEWVEWSIPVPSVEEVVRGAKGLPNHHLGYSAQFLYPAEGGIGILPQSFLPFVKNLNYNKILSEVSLHEKKVWFNDSTSVHFNYLVSTIPLPELLSAIKDLPPLLVQLKMGLRYVSVVNINLGIDSDAVSDQHWVYFPEKDCIFYRVGFYSNFSSSLSPLKKSSLYIEVSFTPPIPSDTSDILEMVFGGLERCGYLKSKDQVETIQVLTIPYAYVVYDEFRYKALPIIMDYLTNHGVYSCGRYGGWRYMSMEDAILQGQEVAEVIRGKN